MKTESDNGCPDSSFNVHRSSSLIWLGALSITAFALWVSADQSIMAGPSAYDDEWFIRTGESAYWFDQGYSRTSFIKEPPYPLFIALSYRLGLPLRLAHEIAYLAAGGFLAWSLVYRQTRAWVGLAVYAAIAFLPAHFFVFERATHDTIYSALLMLAGGALLLQFKRRGENGRWVCWLVTGIALGLLWNTRKERPLAVVFFLPFLIASFAAEWQQARTKLRAVTAWFVEWGPAFLLVGVITVAFMYANYRRWGVFALSNMSTPNLHAAYDALLRIKPDRPIPYVPITRDMRERAYAVSPSFRELRDSLEGHLLAWHGAWNSFQDIPENEYSGGWFILLFGEAVAEAGYYRSGPETEAFYGRMAEELRTAAADGTLPTRTLTPGLGWAVHPDLETYLHKLWPSWRSVWYYCWSEKGPTEPVIDPDVATPEIRDLFNRVACRGVVQYSGQTRQAQIRDWLWTGYNRFAEIALVMGVLTAGVLLVLGRVNNWVAYGLPAFAFGAYGFARMFLFAVFDASMICGSEMRYYFPQALALNITWVWLLAEGCRQFADSLSVPAQRKSNTQFAVGMLTLLGGIVLLLQWGYDKYSPPDYIPLAGELEKADKNEISGWARLKEQPGAVTIELHSDEALVSTGVADRFRQDLLDRHIGTGHHYFSIPTPEILKDGSPHNIKVKIAGTNYVLAAPMTVTFPETQE